MLSITKMHSIKMNLETNTYIIQLTTVHFILMN